MKRIYKRIEVASAEILLTLAFFSDVGGTESVNAANLDRLEAQLSRQNYTGAEQLPIANVQRSHLEITNEGEVIAVLHRLKRGENIFVCKARYGTNISVQLTIDFVVTDPNETTPVEISEDVVLVESIGDGGGGGEFPTDYAKQGTDPDATLTDTQAYAQSAASDAGAAKTAAEAAKDAAQAIVIPSDYAKQGTDPTATNSAILAAVQSISDIESDVQAGRQALATNITAKGIPTSVSDALVTMATKVLQIPQQLNTGISEFEQMIAPSPYMWNVYSVATDLMKETLPQYIPSYMSGGIYAQYRSNNSFFVGEYYLGYDTLELTGADGYLTCDGDFYTISGEAGLRVVTHTLPDGTVETYPAESIIHTWNDINSSYANRWVGFFYLSNSYAFTNVTSEICPRRVALCGQCLSFVVSGVNRIASIWVIGTLGHLEGGTTGTSWDPYQVLNNYAEHTNGIIYNNAIDIKSIVIPNLEIASGNIFVVSGNSNVTLKLESISLPNLIILSKPLIKFNISVSSGASTFNGDIYIPSIESVNSNLIEYISSYSGFSVCAGRKLNIGKVRNISASLLYIDTSGATFNAPSEIIAEDLESVGSLIRSKTASGNRNFIGLKRIYTPKLKSGAILDAVNTSFPYLYLDDLVELVVGEYSGSINLSHWTGGNVNNHITWEQFNANIVNGIANNVADMTGFTAPTFTISTNLYNHLTQETLDAFAAKNWLVAGA